MTEPDLEQCESCLQMSVVKLPTVFGETQAEKRDKKRVGDVTKTGIEENREILKQMQKEARSNEFNIDD